MTDDSTSKPEATQAQAPSAPGPLPGRRLREARERQGLQTADVAERLHLQQAQVEALEHDDYSRFSAPIFISGYVRSYARLLGLDADALVRALEQEGLEQPPILSELTAKMPAGRRSRGLSARARAAVVAGGTIVFLSLLWLLLQPARLGTGESEPGGVSPAAPAPALAPPATGPAAAAAAAPPALPVAGAAAPGTTEPEDEAREEPPPASDGPMDELVLRFNGESWVEVADVTGRRMAYRMANFPDVLRLRGLAPFDILLGNAPNVSIEYNGKPYENVPIGRTNVASFRLGGATDEGVKRDASQESDPPT